MTAHTHTRVLLVILLFSLSLSGCASLENPWGPFYRRTFFAVRDDPAHRPGVPLTLDFSDNSHRIFLMRQFRAADMFSLRNGRDLASAVDLLRAFHTSEPPRQDLTFLQVKRERGVWYPSARITQLTPMAEGEYYAAAHAAIPKALHMILFLQLFDSHTWEPIGELSAVDSWLKSYVSISARGSSESPDVTAVFTYFYHTRKDGTPTAQVLFKSLGAVADPEFSNLEPCISDDDDGGCCHSGLVGDSSCPADNTHTHICFNRNNTNCVQFYDSIMQPVLDIAGTVTTTQTFSASPPTIVSATLTSNIGACDLTSDITISAPQLGTEASWGPTEVAPAGDCLPQTDSGVYYLDMSFTLGLSNGGSQAITLGSDPESCVPDAATGVACIYPLLFVWGCLPTGTPIRMADGSLKDVEEIEVGQKVLADAGGRVLTVVDTFRGTEEDPLLVVEDDRGHRLAMSSTHPTVTARGVLLAKQLKTGDVVTTEDGPATLVKVERQASEEKVRVYNLGLGAEGEEVTRNGTTFFAGGILVGDNRMQGIYEESYRLGAREEIPPAWRRDYERWARRKKEGGGRY